MEREEVNGEGEAGSRERAEMKEYKEVRNYDLQHYFPHDLYILQNPLPTLPLEGMQEPLQQTKACSGSAGMFMFITTLVGPRGRGEGVGLPAVAALETAPATACIGYGEEGWWMRQGQSAPQREGGPPSFDVGGNLLYIPIVAIRIAIIYESDATKNETTSKYEKLETLTVENTPSLG